jgi:hypothetical protein
MSYKFNNVLSQTNGGVTYKETEFLDYTIYLLDTTLTFLMTAIHSI